MFRGRRRAGTALWQVNSNHSFKFIFEQFFEFFQCSFHEQVFLTDKVTVLIGEIKGQIIEITVIPYFFDVDHLTA